MASMHWRRQPSSPGEPPGARVRRGGSIAALACGLLALVAACTLVSAATRHPRDIDVVLANDATRAERESALERILSGEPRERRRLRKACRHERGKLLDSYLERMRERSSEILGSRDLEAHEDEVVRLRAEILALADAEDPGTAHIREESDPAMRRLAELLAVHPNTVLAEDAELRRDRARLLLLSAVLECLEGSDPDLAPSEPTLQGLALDEMLAAMSGWDVSVRDRRILRRNRLMHDRIDPLEGEAVRLLNAQRVVLGLPALAVDQRLLQAARQHSRDMKRYGVLGHDSAVAARKTVRERARAWGAEASGENIAVGPPTPEEVIDAWWHSPSHQRVMLGPHDRIGIGRDGVYWTMVLGRDNVRTPEDEAIPSAGIDTRPYPNPPKGSGQGGSGGSSGGESVPDPVDGKKKD